MNISRPEHQSVDKRRRVKTGDGRSVLPGRERFTFDQTSAGTVSRASQGRLLGAWEGRVWALVKGTVPFRADTGN